MTTHVRVGRVKERREGVGSHNIIRARNYTGARELRAARKVRATQGTARATIRIRRQRRCVNMRYMGTSTRRAVWGAHDGHREGTRGARYGARMTVGRA